VTHGLHLQVARHAEDQSPDPSTRVGAVLACASENFVGFNSFLGGIDPVTATREERYATVVHAEEAVLLRAGIQARGATLYASHEPCGHCSRLAIFAGVTRIIYHPTTDDRRARWECDTGKRLAAAHGVDYIAVPREAEAQP
jgi:dCMP deaminase